MGGVSQCSRPAAAANDPYLSDYDIKKPKSYLIYPDATNFHGKAMNEFLPERGFRWLTDKEKNAFDYLKIADESDKGFLLKYHNELHG